MADRPSADDPYRTLGLEPGATMAEVKRAYRQLAKAYHPDSAGEAALPRFLAIHEAYERLRTGRVTRGAVPGRAAPPAATAEPWRADPARARAARERARAGRAGARSAGGGAGTSGTSAGGRGPGGGAAGGGTTAGARPGGFGAGPDGAPGRGRATGTTGTGGNAAGGSSASGTTGSSRSGRGGRRATRKATMGSTSYDDARDHGDATWSGASWYGPSTGEYWIVNPREYADPRKHGPQYQQRARRAFDDPEGIEAPLDDGNGAPAPEDFVAAAAADRAAFEGAPAASERPAAAGASANAATGRSARARRWVPPASPDDAVGVSPGVRRPGEAAPDREGSWLGSAPREWVGGPMDDPVRRLGVALVAWPPLGLAAAAAIGDVTGCASFSAACTGSDPLLPWLAQAAILGLLLLLPPIARLLAGGAIGVIVALVPVTFFLLAVGGSGEPEAGFALGILLGAAWLAGVAWAATQRRRRTGAGKQARAGS